MRLQINTEEEAVSYTDVVTTYEGEEFTLMFRTPTFEQRMRDTAYESLSMEGPLADRLGWRELHQEFRTSFVRGWSNVNDVHGDTLQYNDDRFRKLMTYDPKFVRAVFQAAAHFFSRPVEHPETISTEYEVMSEPPAPPEGVPD